MSPPRMPSKPMHAWEGDLAVASPAVQRLGEVGGREEHICARACLPLEK